MADRQLPEMYRHWKGDVYLLVRIAIHHDTEEQWAVYRPVEGPESLLYIRPLSEFDGTVRNVQDEEVPRFAVLSAEEGEQVAIDRLRKQLDAHREEVGDDPEGQIVLEMTAHVIETLQNKLDTRLQQD